VGIIHAKRHFDTTHFFSSTAQLFFPDKYTKAGYNKAMQISICRLCKYSNLREILDLGSQSFTGIFPSNRTESVPIGPLTLMRCGNCGLVQLNHNFDKNLMYGDNYGYESSLNSSMVDHLEKIYRSLLKISQITPDSVVLDIGSNDATFLNFFNDLNVDRIGIDPTIKKFKSKYTSDICQVEAFFSKESFFQVSNKKASIITSISMLYDLEDPIEFAKELRECLEDDGVWFFEQSYLKLMVENIAYDTICHEHLSYFSAGTIERLLDESGFYVLQVETNLINGGSIAIFAKKKLKGEWHCEEFKQLLETEARDGMQTFEFYEKFAGEIIQHKSDLISVLLKLRDDGKTIMGLGASTKGNVLLQYVGIDSTLISKIGEVNPEKFNCFTPGTLIPIITEEEVLSQSPDYLFIVPWHFKETFLVKTQKFRAAGGKLIFPLPKIQIVT